MVLAEQNRLAELGIESLTNRRRERIEKRKAFREEMPSDSYQLSQR
jgi:hypothetical protein